MAAGFLVNLSPLARRRLRTLPRWIALASIALGLGAVAAGPAHSSATAPGPAEDALLHAQSIRTEVNSRYRPLSGRTPVVTDATSMGSGLLVLLDKDWLDGLVVEIDHGIFFSICSARARCPYAARRAAWRVAALTPRRQALELALRTFLETTVRLVVVSLPTAQPVWAVFSRDILPTVDVRAVLDRLVSSPAVSESPLRVLVDRLTRSRLFAPVAMGLDDSVIAARLFDS